MEEGGEDYYLQLRLGLDGDLPMDPMAEVEYGKILCNKWDRAMDGEMPVWVLQFSRGVELMPLAKITLVPDDENSLPLYIEGLGSW